MHNYCSHVRCFRAGRRCLGHGILPVKVFFSAYVRIAYVRIGIMKAFDIHGSLFNANPAVSFLCLCTATFSDQKWA